MKLEASEATVADLETAKSLYGPEIGDLTAAALFVWPLTEDNARERTEWSLQQQIDVLENDPTTRFVKVIDADNNNEIVALGRWHRYPHGSRPVGDLEVAGLKDRNDPSTFPPGLNKEFYLGFMDPLLESRRRWMGEGHYWVLTNIVTREPLRKKGAGSLVLEWGLKQAAQEGVPAYLEALVTAMSLYQKHGFYEVGREVLDCEPYGMPGVKFEFANMRADPKL